MWGLHELAWCAWCRLGEAEDSTPHGHSNGAQNTLGDQYGMCMPEWAAWCVVFSGSWSELGNWSLQYILANTQSLAFFTFFLDQHFHFPVTPSTLLCAPGLSGTTPRPLLSSPSPGHHVTSTSGISFLGQFIHTLRSTLGHLQ